MDFGDKNLQTILTDSSYSYGDESCLRGKEKILYYIYYTLQFTHWVLRACNISDNDPVIYSTLMAISIFGFLCIMIHVFPLLFASKDVFRGAVPFALNMFIFGANLFIAYDNKILTLQLFSDLLSLTALQLLLSTVAIPHLIFHLLAVVGSVVVNFLDYDSEQIASAFRGGLEICYFWIVFHYWSADAPPREFVTISMWCSDFSEKEKPYAYAGWTLTCFYMLELSSLTARFLLGNGYSFDYGNYGVFIAGAIQAGINGVFIWIVYFLKGLLEKKSDMQWDWPNLSMILFLIPYTLLMVLDVINICNHGNHFIVGIVLDAFGYLSLACLWKMNYILVFQYFGIWIHIIFLFYMGFFVTQGGMQGESLGPYGSNVAELAILLEILHIALGGRQSRGKNMERTGSISITGSSYSGGIVASTNHKGESASEVY